MMMMMMMMMQLARTPLARLLRTPRGWIPIAFWTALALAGAILARTTGRAHGVDHVMKDTFGFVVMPLLTYGIVSAVLGGGGLRPSLRGVVALGGSAPRAALASVGVAVVSSAIASAIVAALVCVIAHGRGDASIASDLPASFGIAFLGGAAYGAYFCAGSAIGKGALRGVFLAIDWVFGSGAGFGSVFVPRGHITSLLGGSLCFELPRRVSSILLLLLIIVYGALAVRLGRRRAR